MVDRISELPDCILVDILSLLTIREAGRSSVLSHRWRDLWKFITRLNFTASKSMFALLKACRMMDGGHQYVNWVNQILNLYQGGASLNEFIVSFPLEATFSRDIDEWVKFVMSKRVRKLVFDLGYFYTKSLGYAFPREWYLCFMSPLHLSGLKCLTNLSLWFVTVNDEFIEYLLSNCTNLESLVVKYSRSIKNLKVVGSSLNLKHLALSCCDYMESLVLCAPKLVSFDYYGGEIMLYIGKLPHLVDLRIDGDCGQQVTYNLIHFSPQLAQLHTIELNMSFTFIEQLPRVPELTNLKHLNLNVFLMKEISLFHFVSLIEAAPSLERFTLKLTRYNTTIQGEPRRVSTRPHHGLKFIEIFGFVGGVADYELASYLLRNAVNLKRVSLQKEINNYSNKIAAHTRRRVLSLKKMLPRGAELIFV